jgi:hypothetical protein
MDETQAQLIAEQLRHANSLINAELDALRAELGHYRELTNLRLSELETARLGRAGQRWHQPALHRGRAQSLPRWRLKP